MIAISVAGGERADDGWRMLQREHYLYHGLSYALNRSKYLKLITHFYSHAPMVGMKMRRSSMVGDE